LEENSVDRHLGVMALPAVSLFSLFGFLTTLRAQSGANSDVTYIDLRNISLGSESYSVSNFDLHRDTATFHLSSGTVCFTPPVNGKVTGAVFSGEGNLTLVPPSETERKSLRFLTQEDSFNETFQRLALRFTDSTYDDVKKAGTPANGSGCDAGPLKDSQNATRHKLKFNIEIQLLGEVLSSQPRPVFIAFVHGKHYNDKEVFEIDPNHNSDQVSLYTYDENKWGDWASFHLSGPLAPGSFGKPARIEHQELTTTFEKSGNLSGTANTTIISQRAGLRVIRLSLFHTLRVQSVSANGQAVAFIQEDKNADAQFAVVLPTPINKGEKILLTTVYSGKDAVLNDGAGNYYPVARENWYPNDPSAAFGEYSTYDMTFKIPKDLKIAATGVRLTDTNDGGQNITVWKSESAQTVAGFNFGKFKVEEAKLSKPEFIIQSYANENPPDWVESVKRASEPGMVGNASNTPHGGIALGSMSTTALNKKALAEGQIAVEVYTNYFGLSDFTHLQLTQQSACNFGQSWPSLVWIPICYYFDTTVRHQLGLDWGDRGYWKVVTPHEVAHQWWGHTVGFSSGRDQWMSEGFSDMSAALYLSVIEKDPRKVIAFWNEERDLLLERNAQGFRAIDVGPLTTGYRSNNSRTGSSVTRRLIYPKGAYVLHMIRMLLHENATGDQHFKEMMQDFVNTYRGRAATTEDFKAMVEKHMTKVMDVEGNHKMDWFFNEYVYGTQLPTYKFDFSFDNSPEGDVIFNFNVTQSNVDKDFRMVVPLYLELEGGKIVFLGRVPISGNSTVPGKVPLKGLKTKPRRALINYYDDVLASPN
jgi:Peptidase family M1 domain